MYKRSKRKYLLTQQELHRYSNERRTPDLNPFGSPSSNLVLVNNNCTNGQPFIPGKGQAHHPIPSPHALAQTKELNGLSIPTQLKSLSEKSPVKLNPAAWREPKLETPEHESSGSSCETLTSSSENETDSEDDDVGTVIVDGKLSKESLPGTDDESNGNIIFKGPNKSRQPDKSHRRVSEVWNSGALFTLHSFGSEDKPIESEEWVDFLLKTMKVFNSLSQITHAPLVLGLNIHPSVFIYLILKYIVLRVIEVFIILSIFGAYFSIYTSVSRKFWSFICFSFENCM